MGRGRRLAATAALLATASAFAWLGVRHGPSWIEWRSLAFGGGLALASIGITRKNLPAQILSRGLTWVLFAPCAIVFAVELMKGHVNEPAILALGAASGAALALARPMLNTEEAREAFAPSKFRRSFLAVCTMAVTIGLVTGMVAWELLFSSAIGSGLALAALGASMLASAFGVLRMRGWGIALAVLNAILSLGAGAVVGGGAGFALATTAIPGFLFLLPIVLAKLGVGDASASPRVRIASGGPLVQSPFGVSAAASGGPLVQSPFGVSAAASGGPLVQSPFGVSATASGGPLPARVRVGAVDDLDVERDHDEPAEDRVARIARIA